MGTRPLSYQWHVFLASLDPTTGSEQAGRRPVLVISRERINEVLPVVNAIPLTSRKAAARCIYPNEVLLPTGTAGLRVDSIALCYQIRTLDRGRLAQDLGELQKRACVGTSSRRFASSWSCEPFERADQVAHTDA